MELLALLALHLYKSQSTKQLELRFCALLTNSTQQVGFEWVADRLLRDYQQGQAVWVTVLAKVCKLLEVEITVSVVR